MDMNCAVKSSKYSLAHIRKYHLIIFFLFIGIMAPYGQVGNYEFLEYDDNDYITENYSIKSGLSLQNVLWAFTTGHSANWHPLTWISHMLDIQLFGMNAGYHHLTNLFFHIVNTLLWFFLFNRMTQKPWQSAFIAALFGIHPLHVGSVAWISERKDVLSTLFWILTMFSYVRYQEKPSMDRYMVVLLLFVFGLMTKPMLVTLPFVLILIDYWPLKRFEKGWANAGTIRILLEKIPLFIFSVIASIVTYNVQQASGAVESTEAFPLKIRIANAAISYVAYIQKMVWPVRLTGYYPHPGNSIDMEKALAAGILMLLLTIGFVALSRKYSYLAVGWLWFVGALFPVIGIVQVGQQAMADRYTYLPLVGMYIIIAWSAPLFFFRFRYGKMLLGIGSIMIISALMACSWRQVRYWQNDLTFFGHMEEVTDNNYVAHNGLGVAFLEREDYESAILHFNEALRINPDSTNAYANLGIAFMALEDNARATIYYKKALNANPDDPVTLTNYGIAKAKEGNIKEAVKQFKAAIQIRPDYAQAYYNLAITLDEKIGRAHV